MPKRNGQTVKPFLVSLVEPVAYLKSELIIAHWDAVRTILLPPENSCEPESSHSQLGCSQARPHARASPGALILHGAMLLPGRGVSFDHALNEITNVRVNFWPSGK